MTQKQNNNQSDRPRNGRTHSPLLFWIALILLTMAGFAIRASHRHHPMQGDESATYFHYVMPNSFKALFNYTDTNNHIFHSLLAILSTKLRGSGPTAVRIPAFLAGVAIIAAGGLFARSIGKNAFAGIFAAMLLSTSSVLVAFSVNARGYTMVLFFSLLMGFASVQIARRKSGCRMWILWSTSLVLGMWTIPIMVYPAAIFSFMVILQTALSRTEIQHKLHVFKNWGLAVFVCIGITWLLYLPVILQNGFHSLFTFPWVKPHPFSTVLSGIPETFSMLLKDWFRDTSWLYAVLLAVGLASSMLVGIKKRDLFYWMPLIAAVLLVVCTLLQRIVLFARIWLFVLPMVLVSASLGLADIPKWFPMKICRHVAGTLVAVLCTVVSVDSATVVLKRPYFIEEDRTTLVNPETVCKDVAPFCDGKTALVGLWYSSQYSLNYYQILYTPGRIADYKVENTRRAFLAVGDRQDLAWLVAQNPGLGQHYGPFVLWKTYPHSKVYLAYRKTEPDRSQETNQEKAED